MSTDFTLSRRGLLVASGAGVGAVAVGAAGAVPSRAEPAARPNILCLVSEDNNPFLGAYGDRLARTPTLDALATGGILYRNVFSNAPVCAPSRFAIITGMYAESCGPAHNMRAIGKTPAFLRGFPEFLRTAGYYCTNNAKTDYNATIDMAATWDASGNDAHWRNRPAGAPFYAVFNTDITHESKIFTAEPDGTSPADVRVPAYLPDLPDIRRDRAAYYDLVHKMDAAIGARLAELDAAGLAEDTIVFYYSDNGGVLPRSKRYCFDEGLRTAMIVRVPARWRHLATADPGCEITAPVTFVDLPPTILALAGVPAPEYLQGRPFLGPDATAGGYAFGGRNRMDERYDLVRTVTDGRFRYIRNYGPHRPWGQHVAYAWQQRGYRAWERAHLAGELPEAQDRFWREKPAEELYDVAADPDQMVNLACEPRHARLVSKLRRVLREHMIAVNDNGFIPEGAAAEGYDNSRQPGAYPIEDVLALADRAIERSRSNLAVFCRRLTDANEVIRYWAAKGLLMLGPAGAPAAGELADRLAAEPSPRVLVVVAETLARLGRPEPAVSRLAELLDGSSDQIVRLQALDALTFAGPPALAALPAVQRAAASTDTYVHNAGRYLELVLTGAYEPGA